MRQARALGLAGIVGMWVWFVPGAWEIAEVDLDNLVLGMEFALHGGEGTEEEIGGVGHDGGAAGVDLVPGLEFIEFAEGAIDNDSGAEFLGPADEGCSQVGLFKVLPVLDSMLGAEAESWVGDGHAAATATGCAMQTVEAQGVRRNDGARG
jgi:hypothetical protein